MAEIKRVCKVVAHEPVCDNNKKRIAERWEEAVMIQNEEGYTVVTGGGHVCYQNISDVHRFFTTTGGVCLDNVKDCNGFNLLCSEMCKLHEEKNRLYCSSFYETVDEFGLVAGILPIAQQVKSLKQLIKVEKPNFESIKDTLIDLASYSIMLLESIDAHNKNGSL